jgi:predicted ArsR family transcriptional regulator
VRVQGVTRADAAEILGISEKTVQRRLKRSLVLLHETLKDMNPGPGSTLPPPDAGAVNNGRPPA